MFVRHSLNPSDPGFQVPAALRMGRLGFMLARLKPSPFKATAPAGTLAPTLPGWADEGVRPYVDCADVQADKSVRLNVGGRDAPSSTAAATQFPVRMLVSLYCNRVPRLHAGTRPGPSLAQKRRSFRMTTLKVLCWPGRSRALSKLRHERDARAYITRLGGRGRPPLREQ